MKRLDKLTQEEARMATAEMLKITRGVDGNVKVLMDGTQNRTLCDTGCPDRLYHQMAKKQEALCNRKNVCHFLILLLFAETQS